MTEESPPDLVDLKLLALCPNVLIPLFMFQGVFLLAEYELYNLFIQVLGHLFFIYLAACTIAARASRNLDSTRVSCRGEDGRAA